MAKSKSEVDKAVAELMKRFGDGIITRLGDAPRIPVETISTGSLALDLALGVGGLPRGRISEIYGPEAVGKSTVCLHVVAEAQKLGEEAAYVDMEHAFDADYAAAIGVDVPNLWVSQPENGQQALSVVESLVNTGGVGVIIVDSVAALVPKQEIEGEMGDSVVGVQARLMSQAMRKLSGAVSKSGVVVLFVNQLRQKIGVMYGSPETTPGGVALKYYTTIRLDIRRVQAIKDGTEIVGARTRVKVTKNKVAPPFREAEFDLIYGKGIDRMTEVLSLGVSYEIVTKRGAFFSYNDMRLGQGQASAGRFLREHPDIAGEIESKVRAAWNENRGATLIKPETGADNDE